MGGVVGAIGTGLGMSLAGELFGDSDQGSPQTVTQRQVLSPWEEDYWKFISDRARSVANQSYTPYTGERIASLTPEQEAGIRNTTHMARAWEEPFAASRSAYGRALSPFSQDSLDPYMSPYMDSVVDEIGRLGNERFSGVGGIKEDIGDVFTGLGQFASSRHGKVLADAAARNQRETMGQQRMALQGGYEQAMRGYQADRDRLLSGAGALSSLAGQRQALESGTSQGLLNVGALRQQQAQRELDLPYEQFIEQRDWQKNRLLDASRAGAGMSGSHSTSTTSPGPYQVSPMQNFMSGMGLYMSGAQSGLWGPNAATAAPSYTPSYNAAGFSPGAYALNAGSTQNAGGMGYWKKGGRVHGYSRGALVGYKKGGVVKLADHRSKRYSKGGEVSKKRYSMGGAAYRRGGLAAIAA